MTVLFLVFLQGFLPGYSLPDQPAAYNVTQSLHYQCPEEEHILQFQKILRDAGYRTFIRSSRGADISAACGQLASTGARDEQT